jgi:two-component system, chemotaxis family, protein-glutamate methylesterase/glutaminase
MAHRDIVVIGASSGGVEALVAVLAGIPSDFPAAIFVVLHVRPDAPSQLPAILNRVGHLPASHAVDAEPIRRGRVYVAPPGMQAYVHHGRLSVQRGPLENLYRPAIDPLFRTAAHHYGPRVIGVILTGSMDDGSAGLLAVKRGGGRTVVQDPGEAAFSSMPSNAIKAASPDHVVPLSAIAPLLNELVSETVGYDDGLQKEVALETAEEAPPGAPYQRSEEQGNPSNLACPECHGTLWEKEEEGAIRFRCRVGHGFSQNAMIKAHTDSVERALYAAMRALEERVALLQKLATSARDHGRAAVATLLEERIERVDADVKVLHDVIKNGSSLEAVGYDSL